jgi:hypothetical protein
MSAGICLLTLDPYVERMCRNRVKIRKKKYVLAEHKQESRKNILPTRPVVTITAAEQPPGPVVRQPVSSMDILYDHNHHYTYGTHWLRLL